MFSIPLGGPNRPVSSFNLSMLLRKPAQGQGIRRLHSGVPYFRLPSLTEAQQGLVVIVLGWCAFLLAGGTRGLSEMCGQALLSSCTVIFVFCFILLNFVSASRPMDLGLTCLTRCARDEAIEEGEEIDDGVCCKLVGQRPSDIRESSKCHLNMCVGCMPVHSFPCMRHKQSSMRASPLGQ